MKRIGWSLAVVIAAALVGGWALALAAAVTLVLSFLVLAVLSRWLSGGFRVGAALILGAGFAFASVTAISASLPQFPIGALFAGTVFLQQSYAGVLILALLTALVQAVTGGWEAPIFLGFSQPPKAFRGLPILLLTAALALLTLAGFSGLRIG